MRKLKLMPLFTGKTFFLAGSTVFFAAIFLLACSNNNAAAGANGSVSADALIPGCQKRQIGTRCSYRQ